MPSATVIERRTRAVELARSGMSYDDIAKELGYANRSGAWKAVQAALKEHEAEAVDEYRVRQVLALDEMQSRVWGEALAGDTKAIGTVLRVIDQRCRLLGLI